ncbi:MAG: alpha/beta fold hydrolase [Planctomycetota bacterium]
MKAVRTPFRPHPLVPGGTAQTLLGALLPAPDADYRAERHFVDLPDGDRLVLHDDCPAGWQPADKAALLVHGLGGCHGSPYMVRIAAKLNDAGVRAFRLDLRGCGAGERHARGGAHGGSWDDLRAAVDHLGRVAPGAGVELVGFSLGGSLALNLAGRSSRRPCTNLTGVMAVCPPVDLHAVDASFRRGAGRFYSRYFARMMWRQIRRRLREMPNPPHVDTSRTPRHIRELDEQVTAPFHGFRDAAHYYDETSALPHLTRITTPTRIIVSADDPVIPITTLLRAPRSGAVDIMVTRSGGHLGFLGGPGGLLGARNDDPDTRWIDWRVLDWVCRDTPGRRGVRHAGAISKPR